MNTRFVSAPALFGALVLLAWAPRADATHLDACGGIYLDAAAAATCEFVVLEDCQEKCEPVSTEKVCASRLTLTCEAECNQAADDVCVTTCTETCVPDCTTETEPPNCMGLCMSDCQQDCTDVCADAPDQGKCRSSCAQCCSNSCDEECDGEAETTCEPVCETACAGSCDGRADLDCQVLCQRDLYTECEEVVVEECKDECETSGGAIFCDGQFLATGNDPTACAEVLSSELGAEVDVTVAGAVDGDGDGDGGGFFDNLPFSCATNAEPPEAALAFLLVAGTLAVRLRRSRGLARAKSSR